MMRTNSMMNYGNPNCIPTRAVPQNPTGWQPVMVPKQDRTMLTQEIDKLSFALHDTALYLDTHPYDATALAYFNDTLAKKNQAVAEFTLICGPLTYDQVTSNKEWTWGNGPWPWEGVDYTCGNTKNAYNTR